MEVVLNYAPVGDAFSDAIPSGCRFRVPDCDSLRMILGVQGSNMSHDYRGAQGSQPT